MGATSDGTADVDLIDVRMELRAKHWREALNNFYFKFEAYVPEDFRTGRLEGTGYDDFRVGRLVSDPSTAVRTRSHLAHDPHDAYLVLMTNGPAVTVTQNGRVARIQEGSFALVSVSETSSCHRQETSCSMALLIPGPLMRRFAPGVDDLVALTFGDEPLHKMFVNMATLWSSSIGELRPPARNVVGEKIVELLGVTIGSGDHRSDEGIVRLARSSQIRQIVRDHYANPLLDIAFLSSRMNLPARSIRSILTAQGLTLTQLIRERRIAEALQLTQSHAQSAQSARAIAHAVGYRHFDRFAKDMEMVVNGAPQS